ncbi:putative spermidine/putrescine transport system substrate-binding protein [Erwinia toletana]|uniref:Spermidine/putrescine transport system substrate-binding protein n=1 Tax=Winslowiella toletana TaxID=92490 RepID=A0ABS4P9Z8_9GAMM|nr:extracellular solute-binding protein [Winslowiella toletana]MBP2169455.1 putative spermidine/putrescine transport system substrate-binding protein [Winslowiella toletana]
MTSMKRRTFLKAVAGTAMLPYLNIKANAAADRVLQVGVYNSAQGALIKKEVLPAFEKEYNCRVLTTEGATLANIAALRATKKKPVFSVMSMDDIGVPQAKEEGLIEQLPVDEIPNLKNVFDRYLLSDRYGVGFSVSMAGLFINPQVTQPINSYSEIFASKYAHQMILNTPKNTQSILMLIVAAALATGKPLQEAQYEIDKGWEKLAQLKANVMTVYDGEAQVMMVAQSQAMVGGIEYSKAIYPHTKKGIPLDMTYPKEGAFTGINGLALVKDAPQRELGLAWINRLLEPSVQKMLAEVTLSAPTVRGIEFDEQTLKYLAYPEDKMKALNLFTPDWTYIIPRRAELLEKYNQTFTG